MTIVNLNVKRGRGGKSLKFKKNKAGIRVFRDPRYN